MATVPCTIVVFSQDRVNFPIKVAHLVMKQLFQYGVKDMKQKDERIFMSLSYSPKAKTLKKKFGNLPVRYMRIKLNENEFEQEFKQLEKVVLKYRFNLLDEKVDDDGNIKIIEGANKRKRYLMPPKLVTNNNDDDDDNTHNDKSEDDEEDNAEEPRDPEAAGPSSSKKKKTTNFEILSQKW